MTKVDLSQSLDRFPFVAIKIYKMTDGVKPLNVKTLARLVMSPKYFHEVCNGNPHNIYPLIFLKTLFLIGCYIAE